MGEPIKQPIVAFSDEAIADALRDCATMEISPVPRPLPEMTRRSICEACGTNLQKTMPGRLRDFSSEPSGCF